jgi:cell division protein FtsB
MSKQYKRDTGSGALISTTRSGSSGREALKANYARLIVAQKEIETLKTKVAALEAAVTALQNG